MTTGKNVLTQNLRAVMDRATVMASELSESYKEILKLSNSSEATPRERSELQSIVADFLKSKAPDFVKAQTQALNQMGVAFKNVDDELFPIEFKIKEFSTLDLNITKSTRPPSIASLPEAVIDMLKQDTIFEALSRLSVTSEVRQQDRIRLAVLANTRGISMVRETEQELGVSILPDWETDGPRVLQRALRM